MSHPCDSSYEKSFKEYVLKKSFVGNHSLLKFHIINRINYLIFGIIKIYCSFYKSLMLWNEHILNPETNFLISLCSYGWFSLSHSLPNISLSNFFNYCLNPDIPFHKFSSFPFSFWFFSIKPNALKTFTIS